MNRTTMIVPKPKKLSVYRWVIFIAITFVYVWAFSGVPLEGIKDTAGEITKAIMTGVLNPDWSYVSLPDGEDLLHGLIDTLAIAILGTFISAFLSVPFAFWAATNMSSGKFVLSFVRTFPELVMALLFIKAVGPGSFAGVLALGLHSIGMLGKLYSEGIENIDKGPTEALLATGANRFQILWYAVLPQVLPDFLSYTLYRFEINVRSAAILGVIGAGGIGTPLIFALSSRNWSRVGIILLGIILMVIIIDLISSSIRKRIV
ncbi:phosphonate ABC transporter, permease protein PhnE [Bacillus thuringiensis]|uniref:Phosphonate ABC transporter permease n=1 Tax=Bacillus thuringiensis HD-771 TaxID=1218175 RepID=A0A9W3NVB8_BACTU|nr:phosphonate ABC transporter, permease protein PhnE [Bacillus thuringiensis]EEM40659.1 Phosphonate ABC transporter, permease protein [Bacillus thuringiensis serovar sotto str. T04001]MDA2097282.1 phosphonate ABC transporter, permease protein PhnE [Bacillus cereus]AFQ13699.1 phosphonate ABC transporter permease [Bacillus thuringiensis HD-771]MDA2103693.1 phosphonate ABC transporter, permease protein PhnE [Bacillus cereus]MEB4893799.1 phosphonate ABC transporter, permease protein PhnE [Bacillu